MPISRRDLLEKSAGAAARNAGPRSDRPNVLYVILEDAGFNVGGYGELLVRTPNIDRLASQGVAFDHAFCAAPVCSASRSGLMTGRYQNNIGAHNHRTPAGLRAGTMSIPLTKRLSTQVPRGTEAVTCTGGLLRGRERQAGGVRRATISTCPKIQQGSEPSAASILPRRAPRPSPGNAAP